MDFMVQGLLACFNMLRHEASKREKLTNWMVEEAHKQERRQKEIYAKLDMPHSPVHEPQVFTPLLFRMMGLRKKTLVDVRKMLVSPMKKKALFMEMM
jgi:hypothetical protein